MSIIGIDTESTGLSPYKGHKIFAFTTCNTKLEKRYFPFPERRELLKWICENEGIEKVWHNRKYDEKMINQENIELKGINHDTLVMIHLLNEYEPSKKLKDLARKYLKDPCHEQIRILNWCKKHDIDPEDQWSQIPKKLMIPYAKKDPELTIKLYFLFHKPVMKDFRDLYFRELSLIPVIIAMENRGIPFDKNMCRFLKEEYKTMIIYEKEKACKIARKRFNLNSPKQVGVILKKAGVKNLVYTEKGNISTGEKILPKYKHPITKHITRFRSFRSWRSTYLEGVPEQVIDGIIHPHFDILGARTGRLSCWEPNLQNQPEELRIMYPVRKGYTNYYIDESQIEILLFAHYSNERRMIDELQKKGGDLHLRCAKILWNSRAPNKRKKAKTINYTIIYGGGSSRLGDELNIPQHKARQHLTNYFTEFPEAQSFLNRVQNKIQSGGHIYNKFGRCFRVPKKIAYKGINYLIQGTAADIIKSAMIRVFKILAKESSNMLLTIHDELVIETPNEDRKYFEKKLLPRIKKAMTSFKFLKLRVNLKVNVKYSTTNWGEKKKLRG